MKGGIHLWMSDTASYNPPPAKGPRLPTKKNASCLVLAEWTRRKWARAAPACDIQGLLGRNDLKLPVISAHLFSNLKMGTCFVWGEVGVGGGWGWGA